ncbi:MAG TPA: HNH endonuclease signature motif containing protein [Planctomycetota bacterium]|jgi:5-methylcytosine-specific restriction endonuclease McrA|nr:HNH endonuclease signature motif containing protein [Planctomycetota bacterium]
MAYIYPFKNAPNDLVSKVWWKGIPDPAYDSKVRMKDRCGHVMKWLDHGKRNAEFGWEIDHIVPTAHGGSDDLSNLQPLWWQNNADKADRLNWKCGT